MNQQNENQNDNQNHNPNQVGANPTADESTTVDQTAIVPGMPISQSPGPQNDPAGRQSGGQPGNQFAGLGAVAQGQPVPAASANQAGAPAQPGAPIDGAANPSGDYTPAVTWRSKYDKEHKRVKILAGTTAAATVVAIALGVWGATSASRPSGPDFAAGQMGGPGGMSQGGPGGFGGPGGQGGPSQMLSNLFNSDGSVNTERLNELKSRAPQGIDLTQMIDRAQESGAITEDQATKLKAALGSSSSSGSGTNSNFDSDSGEDGSTDSDGASSSEVENA